MLSFLRTCFSLALDSSPSPLCQGPLITGSLVVVLDSDFLLHTFVLPHVAAILFLPPRILREVAREHSPRKPESTGAFGLEFVMSATHLFSVPTTAPYPSTPLPKSHTRPKGLGNTVGHRSPQSPLWEVDPKER